MENINKYVTYIRVSTTKQGNSGLGLEGQKQMIANYIKNDSNSVIVAEFEEIESGKKNKRPQLQQAIEMCKSEKATLIIAKLDRLARNVAFVSSLNEAKINFICCDNPHANKLTINILSSIAEYEAELISNRTKQALQVLKNQGVKLGKPENLTDFSRQKSIDVRREKAIQNVDNQRAKVLVNTLRNNGKKLQEIANILNDNGYKTSTGKQFQPTTVSRLLD